MSYWFKQRVLNCVVLSDLSHFCNDHLFCNILVLFMVINQGKPLGFDIVLLRVVQRVSSRSHPTLQWFKNLSSRNHAMVKSAHTVHATAYSVDSIKHTVLLNVLFQIIFCLKTSMYCFYVLCTVSIKRTYCQKK